MKWLGQIWHLVVGDPAAPEPYDMERIREMIDMLKDVDPVAPVTTQPAV